MNEEIILESKVESCLKCGANISSHQRSSQILIYTETGPKLGRSIDKRCSNQECKSGFFLGYYTPKNQDDIKIYQENALKEEYIISTSDTAFATSLLYDGVLAMKCGNNAFKSTAHRYNLKHEYNISNSGVQLARAKLSDKCFANGIWRYALLDIERRYGVEIEHNKSIDITLEKHLEKIHAKIEEIWLNHQCSTPGCGSILVCDGGMKPHRR